MSIEVLCIGGSSDKRILTIDSDSKYFRVPVLTPMIIRDPLEIKEYVNLKYDDYEIERLHAGGKIFFIARLKEIPVSTVFQILLDNYRNSYLRERR